MHYDFSFALPSDSPMCPWHLVFPHNFKKNAVLMSTHTCTHIAETDWDYMEYTTGEVTCLGYLVFCSMNMVHLGLL
jgi:hypothetical protein